jgi:hypothetical protein
MWRGCQPTGAGWGWTNARSARRFVLAVVIVLVGVIPAVNNAISWTNQTKAGDVIDMGGGITFAAPEGWTLTNGYRTTGTGAPSP